jgi:hypothetical protein
VESIESRMLSNVSYLYVNIPNRPDNYFEYKYQESYLQNKIRAIPILIYQNGKILNPLKQDRLKYEVSSQYKEQLLAEHLEIQGKECLFMVAGAQYRFPIKAERGTVRVHLYFDYSRDFVVLLHYNNDKDDLQRYPSGTTYMYEDHIMTKVDVEFISGKSYKLEITDSNKINNLGKGIRFGEPYNGKLFEKPTPLQGFYITLEEMQDNTKFNFNGKDDVGKTMDQVEKEFYFRDKAREKLLLNESCRSLCTEASLCPVGCVIQEQVRHPIIGWEF